MLTQSMPRFLKYSLVLLLPLLLISCREQFHWRQKLTVTVETPVGEVSGASVTEVFTRNVQGLQGANDYSESSFHGEAVVVEVMPGRYLFALLKPGLASSVYVRVEPGSPYSSTAYEENMSFIMDQVGEPPVPMPEESLPILVTFDDINDPATVREVDPRDFAASFGPGVRLTSVTIQITDEPVTEGKVEAVLGWIPKALYIIPPAQQPIYVKDQTVEQKLMPSDFIDWRTMQNRRP